MRYSSPGMDRGKGIIAAEFVSVFLGEFLSAPDRGLHATETRDLQ